MRPFFYAPYCMLYGTITTKASQVFGDILMRKVIGSPAFFNHFAVSGLMTVPTSTITFAGKPPFLA